VFISQPLKKTENLYPKKIHSPYQEATKVSLIIDDDEKIAKINKRMLEELGYHATALTKSEEALNSFQQTPESIDLVITDMTMPHMTGAELTKKLLAIRPDIPIIMCTGFSDQINKDEAIRIGISDFIMKPVNKMTLALSARKALNHSPLKLRKEDIDRI
jgi:PleD family two-component response regulator